MKRTKELKEKNYKESRKNLVSHSLPLTSDHEGITLIALVITIIIMLMLATVSIRIAVNGGLFAYAGRAVKETRNAINVENSLKDGKITIDGYTYSIDDYLAAQKGERPTITVGDKSIILTPDNVEDYLGKVVINYKTGEETTESIKIKEKSYTVSTKYRLYYIDFEGKYGEGKGTIYLKADDVPYVNSTALSLDSTTLTEETEKYIKIKALNPELYKKENILPNEDNPNMKAVKWLTNTKNWEGLKEGVDSTVKAKIKYIVGAPSLEMMMDSYNTHYKLTGDTPDTSELNEKSPRVKLFYKYFYDNDICGYYMGPSLDNEGGYGAHTLHFTVKFDPKINGMFYPIYGAYWIASPSTGNIGALPIVTSNDGGYIGVDTYGVQYLLCPLVCLESSAQLKLQS